MGGNRGQAESPASSLDPSLLRGRSFKLLRVEQETHSPMGLRQRFTTSGEKQRYISLPEEAGQGIVCKNTGRVTVAGERTETKTSPSGGGAENHPGLLISHNAKLRVGQGSLTTRRGGGGEKAEKASSWRHGHTGPA